jgi:hypothetical protein
MAHTHQRSAMAGHTSHAGPLNHVPFINAQQRTHRVASITAHSAHAGGVPTNSITTVSSLTQGAPIESVHQHSGHVHSGGPLPT